MLRNPKKLGEILIEQGCITDEQLQQALQEQKKSKVLLGEILVKKGFIKEHDLLTALSNAFDIALISLENKYIDWNFVKEFSASLILDFKCFPIVRDAWSVTLAITNPLDAWVIQKAEEATRGSKLKLVLVSGKDMDDVIQRYKQYMKGNISGLFESQK